MKQVSAICVYCGSSNRVDPVYLETAKQVGSLLAEQKIRLIFGGGGVGLMGAVADAVLDGDGEVIGVMPQFLEDIEVAHERVTELVVVDSMHTRKQKMFDLSDAFLVLPGGYGTLDEMVEIITWKQLHRHDKPVLIVNVAGYWNPFLRLIDSIIENRFARPKDGELFTVLSNIEEILPALARAPEPTLHTALSGI
ncbi:MAG: TIGR00730 family Rossman fold protein [Alphaproteobacteria bacterium]|nr:TIGR00730 family Rossman fold protein [Alphaproteobacteria bacterium]